MLHVVIAGATRSITSRKVRDELINSVSSAYSISGGQHRCRLVDVCVYHLFVHNWYTELVGKQTKIQRKQTKLNK